MRFQFCYVLHVCALELPRFRKNVLKHNLRPMLELESGSNDPMAYMLTIVLIQIILSGSMNAGEIAGNLAVQFLVGGAGGYILGKLTVLFLNKINIDNQSLYAILLLGCVFFTFTITDRLHGNGYLAVYIAGMVVGNKKIVFRKEIATFMDGMSWLFQIIMFLTLGLLVNPHEMLNVALVAILIGVFLILIGRPLSVFLCLLPFRKINFKSKLFVSWVGLRGAVPIIFATYPVVAGVEGSNSIFNIVFFITIVSLVVQGTSISFFARLLHLSTPLPQTGNEFGVELPEEIDSSLSDMTAHAAAMAPAPEAQPAAPDAADSSPVRSAKATQLYLQAMLRTLAQPRAEELALQIGAASEPIDLLRAFTEGAGYFLRMAGEERAGHMRTKLRDILPLEYTQRMASLLKDD